jgi:hypothetical protein
VRVHAASAHMLLPRIELGSSGGSHPDTGASNSVEDTVGERALRLEGHDRGLFVLTLRVLLASRSRSSSCCGSTFLATASAHPASR